jgi:gamma-glutamylaminecyclotransferase
MLNEIRDSNPDFQLIFVYGSLKRGQTLHYLLRDQPFVGEAWTIAEYRLFHLGAYPGLVQSDSGISVQGELFRVDAACLKRLDIAEGVDEGLYQRKPIQLLPPFQLQQAQAWFYCRSVSAAEDCGNYWGGNH